MPALFRAVVWTHGDAERNPERIDLSGYINQIMGPLRAPDLCDSMKDYREEVGRRYHGFCKRYGTNLVYLFEGELLLEPATAAAADLQPAQISLFRDALDTDEPFAIGEWEWISRGYARIPRPYGETRDFEKRPWFSLASTVHQAMDGLKIPSRAIALHASRSNDPEFVQIASEFIADVSSDDLTAIWRSRVEANDDLQITYLLCAALLRRGYLVDVPFVLQTYCRNESHAEFTYVQLLLNELLVRSGVCKVPV